MNFLVVSDREFKKTSRGIDIITGYLAEKGHFVDHLVFFKRKRFPEKQVTNNIRQLYFYDPIKIYRSRLQFIFPGFILLFYFKYIIKKQSSINFVKYDYVVLESGHPLYLASEINNRIIYRQSDPTYISFNSNRLFYKKLENDAIKKAFFATSAIENKYFPEEYKDKIIHWHSGFIPPKQKLNTTLEKCFVIISGELDWSLIHKMAKKYPDYQFNILSVSKKKTRLNNISVKGYLDYDNYLKIISSALIAIIPYSVRFAYQHRQHSYTAKIMVPMYLGIPILLKNYGSIQDTDTEKKLFVYRTHNEALTLLEKTIQKIESGNLNRKVSKTTLDFLTPQISENRLKELDGIFRRFLE